jgi:NADPH:quinone reductase-like Zn-dependent oxidoreductase
MKSYGYAAHAPKSPLVPFDFERRDADPNDVVLEILYSGICHSDIHQVRGEWGNMIFPMVLGHEIVGRVTRVGANVTKFKAGDLGAVGVMVPAQDPDSWSTFGRIAIQAGPNRDGRVDDLARDKGPTKRIDRGNSTQTGADRVGSARDGPGLSSGTRGTDCISGLSTSNIKFFPPRSAPDQ